MELQKQSNTIFGRSLAFHFEPLDIRAIHLRLEIAITYTFAFLDLAIRELHHMRCSALILRIHYIYSVSFCVHFSYGE